MLLEKLLIPFISALPFILVILWRIIRDILLIKCAYKNQHRIKRISASLKGVTIEFNSHEKLTEKSG